MRIRVWAKTNRVGSKVEEVIEVDDDAGPETLEDVARQWLFDNIDWSYEPLED